MPIRIVTDSTADLAADIVERYGITVVPLNVHFGSEVFKDGVTISRDEFYLRLEQSAALPRTSQPSAGAFQATYEALADAEAIVSIHIGGKLSGTVNAARTGAGLLAKGSPPVEVVDSNQASMGLGFSVIAAAQAAEAGADRAAVVQAALEAAQRSRILLFVDTLEYLQKGGRIGRARAFLGTLLRTKPVLELRDGEIEGIERPRTRTRAMDRLYELVLRTPRAAEVAVLYASTPDQAQALADQVRQAFPAVPVSVVQVSPVIGVHTGPGAVGAAILQDVL